MAGSGGLGAGDEGGNFVAAGTRKDIAIASAKVSRRTIYVGALLNQGAAKSSGEPTFKRPLDR